MSSQSQPLPLTRKNVQRLLDYSDSIEAQSGDTQREKHLNAWEERLRAKERELEEREDAFRRRNCEQSIGKISSSQEDVSGGSRGGERSNKPRRYRERRKHNSSRKGSIPCVSGSNSRLFRMHRDDDATSISTNATESDRPGPGRTLGNLYSRGGRLLERCIASLAYKCGYGPVAAHERLQHRLLTGHMEVYRKNRSRDNLIMLSSSIRDACFQLFNYAVYVFFELYGYFDCALPDIALSTRSSPRETTRTHWQAIQLLRWYDRPVPYANGLFYENRLFNEPSELSLGLAEGGKCKFSWTSLLSILRRWREKRECESPLSTCPSI